VFSSRASLNAGSASLGSGGASPRTKGTSERLSRAGNRIIDGALFPVLAAIGLLKVLGIVTFNSSVYWGAFFVVLVASFIPGVAWKRYI
jgi:hypothetical protein